MSFFDDTADYKSAKAEVISDLSEGGLRPTKGEWQLELAGRRNCSLRTIRSWELKVKQEATWAMRRQTTEPIEEREEQTGTDG